MEKKNISGIINEENTLASFGLDPSIVPVNKPVNAEKEFPNMDDRDDK